jgi:DNA-binding transcriptional MerR regulator
MSVEKCTIPAAAKALGVSQKTIYRYLNNGTLSRIREGKNTYIMVDEVRTLRTDMSVSPNEAVRTNHTDTDRNTITINLTEYKELLQEVGHYKGQLEGQTRNLLENKAIIEGKDKVILDQQSALEQRERELSDLRRELEMSRLPWYKKLFGRGKL